MASLQQKWNGWHCQLLFERKRHTFAIGKDSKKEAETKAQNVDYLLMRLSQGLLSLPAGMDIVTFVRFDGTPPPTTVPRSESGAATLDTLRDRYLATHAESLEKT